MGKTTENGENGEGRTMRIGGFQKMTVLDYPGKIAATVFTYGCNLRCPFCHNASLVVDDSELLSVDEILRYLAKRRGILDGVCVSGGEPLLQPDIESLLRAIRDLGLQVKLDTNGTLPHRLADVTAKGLVDYVAMDIKNAPSRYPETVGCAQVDLDAVRESASLLMRGNIPYEFRTTVVRELHGDDEIEEIGRWIAGAERYFLQGFIDSGNLIGGGLSAYTKEEMERLCAVAARYVPSAAVRGV